MVFDSRSPKRRSKNAVRSANATQHIKRKNLTQLSTDTPSMAETLDNCTFKSDPTAREPTKPCGPVPDWREPVR